MANDIVKAMAQNAKTFQDCREYLYKLFGNDVKKVVALEDSSIASCLPYYISYLESRGVKIEEAFTYFKFDNPTTGYWEVLKITVVLSFRKVENNDFDYNLF